MFYVLVSLESFLKMKKRFSTYFAFEKNEERRGMLEFEREKDGKWETFALM